jgi:hypothetical protein
VCPLKLGILTLQSKSCQAKLELPALAQQVSKHDHKVGALSDAYSAGRVRSAARVTLSKSPAIATFVTCELSAKDTPGVRSIEPAVYTWVVVSLGSYDSVVYLRIEISAYRSFEPQQMRFHTNWFVTITPKANKSIAVALWN